MKKTRILLASIMAVAVCGTLTACGKAKEEATKQPDITETTEESTTEE